MLVAQVFRFHPFDLAVAFDDNRQALFFVSEHSLPDSSLERLVDDSTVLAEDTIHVFLRFGLHSTLWRWTDAQTVLSYTVGDSDSTPSATNVGSGPEEL